VKDDEWEICDIWHDVKKGVGKHKIRLSIPKESKYRNTYCITCGKPVLFERVSDSNVVANNVINPTS
jgi:hypothetical protein